MQKYVNMEDMLSRLFSLREGIAELNSQKTALQAEYDEIEYHLIQKMQSENLSNAGIPQCTCSIAAKTYPKVEDMESFARWCVDNGRTDMIQKRVSSAAFTEFYNEENVLPDGLDTYDAVKLSIRKR